MELIIKKLDKIRDAWNFSFLDYDFCRKHINYSEEVATNYFGDIASYFDDTFPIISQSTFDDDRKEHLSSAIALLQAIYVQQDLIDELMIIFALPKSNSDFKEENRKLRNQLVGHPISRDKTNKSLSSSVLFRYDNPTHEITYVLYEASNGFKGSWRSISISSIIDRHEKYLNKNFDIILKKIITILFKHRKELKRILKSLPKRIKFELLIEDVFTYFDKFSEFDYTYKRERLLEYYQRRSEHTRYAYAIQLFKQELKATLIEKIDSIKSFGKECDIHSTLPEIVSEIKIKFVSTGPYKGKKRRYKKDMSYEFGKLHQKDHPVGVDYFLERFGNWPTVGDELRHMKTNIYNDTEYYASYNYLKKLLKGVHSTMFFE
ncbi:MAG: hypothetical protein IBJ16_07550 [Chitinophagaceae bacterium]|nr:hypothetical protein [Chitinophagaceae bacterium]